MFSLDRLRVTKSMQYPGAYLAPQYRQQGEKKANLKLKINSGIFVSDPIQASMSCNLARAAAVVSGGPTSQGGVTTDTAQLRFIRQEEFQLLFPLSLHACYVYTIFFTIIKKECSFLSRRPHFNRLFLIFQRLSFNFCQSTSKYFVWILISGMLNMDPQIILTTQYHF